ncbi:hypothetical protein PTKIN_Ptkin04bG0175500 [Pterospermum kingtungense]
MAILLTYLAVLFVSLFLQEPTTAQTCLTSCSGGRPVVQFPFGLNADGNRNRPCSYPGFGLSCSNKTGELVLNLPQSGEFLVEQIDYQAQHVWISDPDACLANRFFQSFNVSGTPFDSGPWDTVTFFNCSASEAADAGLPPIPCLSNQNYSIVVLETKTVASVESTISQSTGCHSLRTVRVPVFVSEGAVLLEWYNPDCSSCVERGGDCGLKNRTTQEIGCFNLPSQDGLSRGAKYGLSVGVGIPGFLCLIGLVSFVGSRVRRNCQRRRNLPGMEFSTSISPSPPVIVTGLDGPTIESYPKTKLGESGRLPEPNDNTCPICLSEYQPKETLRTIPECSHYFHANCIDEWLKLNGSCPLCRNSPGGSAAITPSISSSSSSSSSSSPS